MKKLTALILALALAFLTAGALASGGSAGDPLVSLSYLTTTYKTTLTAALEARAEEAAGALYQEARDKLDRVGSALLGGEEETQWMVSTGYRRESAARGDALTLDTGSGILWYVGTATASGPLVDVTAGAVLPAGSPLQVNHRYLNGEEGTAAVTVQSDSGAWAYEGTWQLTRSGAEVTPFTDLISTQWYYSGVRWAVDRGLMAGVSGTVFAPNSTTTRSMVVTILYRMEGTPALSEEDQGRPFDDVEGGTWYTDGVYWARCNGIVDGVGGNRFDPGGSITREQLATMLYRYAAWLGADTTVSGSLSAFPDGEKVSAYAVRAMEWAVGAGIISGSEGKLLPQSGATRAQIALMLQRFTSFTG